MGLVQRGEYWVEADHLVACVVAFDTWRDGLGKFNGDLGRAAFLRGTSDIAQRLANRLPYDRRADPWFAERLTRALRTELAGRPRKTKPQPAPQSTPGVLL